MPDTNTRNSDNSESDSGSNMPTRIRDISDLVQVLTGCSSTDADRAGAEICRTPEAAAALASACGLSVYGVGQGGHLLTVGLASTASGVAAPVGVPAAILGTLLGGAGAYGAKRFCGAMVRQVGRISAKSASMMYLEQ